MSQYNLQQFIKLWAREQLTSEQAIGQILLHLQDLTQRMKDVEVRIRTNQKIDSDREAR